MYTYTYPYIHIYKYICVYIYIQQKFEYVHELNGVWNEFPYKGRRQSLGRAMFDSVRNGGWCWCMYCNVKPRILKEFKEINKIYICTNSKALNSQIQSYSD